MNTIKFELKDAADGTKVSYRVGNQTLDYIQFVDYVDDYVKHNGIDVDNAQSWKDIWLENDADKIYKFALSIGIDVKKQKIINKEVYTSWHNNPQTRKGAGYAYRKGVNKYDYLKVQWAMTCNGYAKAFAEKHDFDIEIETRTDSLWIDGPGSIANICDMFVDMDDMRYDMDNNIVSGMFEQWYWKNTERQELGIRFMDFKDFCNGCVDPVTPDKEEEIKALGKKLNEAKQLFEDAIRDYKTNGK